MPENTVPAEFVKIEDINELPFVANPMDGNILFFDENDTEHPLKTADLKNFKKEIQTGIVSDATPSSSPTAYNPTDYPDGLYEKYDVKTAGTYTNFLDASTPTPQPIQVTSDDIKYNFVQIWVKNGVSQKVLSEKPVGTANGDVEEGETQAISGNTAFKTLVEGAIVTVYNTWEAGYYFTTGGPSTGTTYGMQRTPKFLLRKGETLKFGVNTYNVAGSTAAIFNIYNLDGSFKQNILTQNAYMNQFKQDQYTAQEDVLVALVDFSTSTIGQKYIEIHSLNKAALNPLDSRVTTIEGSQNEIFNGTTSLLPAQSIPIALDSFYTATGGNGGNGSGHKKTGKFLLKKGRTVNFGVNVFTSNGIAILNLYNADGTFITNIYKPSSANYSTFYTGSYTALQDVYVGISDYTNGNYGTAYVTIAAQQGSNYNKGLTKLLDDDPDKVVKTDYEATQMYLRGRATQNLSSVKKIGIIVAGQSNTEGRVPIAQLPSYISSNNNTVPNVQMWNDSAKVFQPFKFGSGGNTGQEAPGATPSPLSLYAYDAIAAYLLAQYKSQTVYLIKRAQGGTAISTKGTDGGGYWTPFTENIPTGKNKLIEEFKTKILNALAATPDLEIKGCIYHQAEGDWLYPAAVEFFQGFKDVIAFTRGIVGNPKLPFIFGTVAPVSAQYSPIVNAAFQKVFAEDKFAFLIDMSDGTLLDAYHFDAASTQLFGQRVFDVLKTL